MKTTLLFILLFVASIVSKAQYNNMPSPTSNLQTLTNGSYVIAMGNNLQANTAGNFNLKVYGLIVHLLNNNVKLKWVIKAGKGKDSVDFIGNAEQIQPTYSVSASRNFKAGPFVIYAADTTGVAALINSYYTSRGLTGNDRPKVYRLTAAVANVDIRFDMSGFKPKVVILNDGTNGAIHEGYMTKCGITTSNYNFGPATDLYTKCYTFASEPHNGSEDAATITAIKSFVQKGGNFLAQCAAIETYENSTYGRFHSTTGFTVTNSNVTPASTIIPNADLSFSQYEGVFDINLTGSVKNWVLKSGGAFKNNEHNHGTGGTILAQSPIGASVAKLTGAALPGGHVFYLGSHEFASITTIESINGIRMYMNAMLTPVVINSDCNIGAKLDYPLPVNLLSFNAKLDQSQSKVKLTWTTAQEINASHFLVERSTDGINFQEIGLQFAQGNSMEKINYEFTDDLNSVDAKLIHYRLLSVDIDQKAKYSETRIVRLDNAKDQKLTIFTYPNPVTNELRITNPSSWQNKPVLYELYSANGRMVNKIATGISSQTEIMNISNLAPGFYILKATSNGVTAQQKIIKQ